MTGGVGSMNAQRLLVAANADLPGKIEHISRELWMRTWSRVSSCNNNDCTHTMHCMV